MPHLSAHPSIINKYYFFVLDGRVHLFYAYSEPAQGFYAWESS